MHWVSRWDPSTSRISPKPPKQEAPRTQGEPSGLFQAPGHGGHWLSYRPKTENSRKVSQGHSPQVGVTTAAWRGAWAPDTLFPAGATLDPV